MSGGTVKLGDKEIPIDTGFSTSTEMSSGSFHPLLTAPQIDHNLLFYDTHT
jgi:hypothetical protein